MKEKFEGICRFCGQIQAVKAQDQAEADEIATKHCNCDDSKRYQKAEKLKDNLNLIAGDGCTAFGYLPVKDNVLMSIIDISNLVIDGAAQAISINVDNTVIKISANTKGDIKANRKETRSIGTEC